MKVYQKKELSLKLLDAKIDKLRNVVAPSTIFNVQWSVGDRENAIEDGTTGVGDCLKFDFAFEILGWTIMEAEGPIKFDIYARYKDEPDRNGTICGENYPETTDERYLESTALTDWTHTKFAAGTVLQALAFDIDGVTIAHLSLKCKRITGGDIVTYDDYVPDS